jgi:hypothetical protein
LPLPTIKFVWAGMSFTFLRIIIWLLIIYHWYKLKNQHWQCYYSGSGKCQQCVPLCFLILKLRILRCGNQVQLPSSNSDNAATTVPQQSSSVEQASTSSTVAVIVGQAAQSRRSRLPSESTTTRRTRRRQQH